MIHEAHQRRAELSSSLLLETVQALNARGVRVSRSNVLATSFDSGPPKGEAPRLFNICFYMNAEGNIQLRMLILRPLQYDFIVNLVFIYILNMFRQVHGTQE